MSGLWWGSLTNSSMVNYQHEDVLGVNKSIMFAMIASLLAPVRGQRAVISVWEATGTCIETQGEKYRAENCLGQQD